MQNEDGICECSSTAISIFDECISEGAFAGIVSGVCVAIGLVFLSWFLNYKKRKNDEVWHVKAEELHFSHPVEIVGQGAFGVVLLAEYRGTQVAIKRVLQKQDANKRSGSVASVGSILSFSGRNKVVEEEEPDDIEEGEGAGDTTTSGTTSGFKDLDFLGAYSFDANKSRFRRWLDRRNKNDSSRYNLSILGSVSNANSMSRGLATWLFPACNETARRH